MKDRCKRDFFEKHRPSNMLILRQYSKHPASWENTPQWRSVMYDEIIPKCSRPS